MAPVYLVLFKNRSDHSSPQKQSETFTENSDMARLRDILRGRGLADN